MTAKELREAAEWSVKGGEWQRKTHTELFGKWEPTNEYIFANYILANVQEDGEEPVDETWLREEWGASDSESQSKLFLGNLVLTPYADGKVSIKRTDRFLDMSTESVFIAAVTTRSQFRSLMKGLGVEPRVRKGD